MSIIYFIKKNYQMVEERSFGYASGYLVTSGNKKGYLNKQGKVVIPAKGQIYLSENFLMAV